MRRIRLNLAGTQVEFVDREQALRRVEYWAERGMSVVHVVYGPEGCGKTAWLKQSVELLRELGFDVVYVNPLDKEQLVEVSVVDLKRRFLEVVRQAMAENALTRIAWSAYELVHDLIKAGRRKVAILADDVFQVIGIRESAMYVKALLNLIEYPPAEYERVITVAATSEGLSRREIGRHRWADLDAMWNITKEGFRQLYEQLPGSKPEFEEVWRLTGGNPKLLGRLYEFNWNVDSLIRRIQDEKRIPEFITSLSSRERELLREALENPDSLVSREGLPLLDRLVELNVVVDAIPVRDQEFWIDTPPPERDSELGIGLRVAWQTPIHREAVRKALESVMQ
ncbi:ATP-binding protein [Vulcanisaeta sp. JCM 14467]